MDSKPRTSEEPKQTPEFIALTTRLRHQQARREYNKMVASVDSTQNYGHTNYMQDFGKEMKEVNRQVIAIINVVITVLGAFAFGFYGVSFAYPSLNLTFETRMIMGMCAATVVFFADLYFVVKSMDAQVPTADLKDSSKTFALDTKNLAHKPSHSVDEDDPKKYKRESPVKKPQQSPAKSPKNEKSAGKSPKAQPEKSKKQEVSASPKKPEPVKDEPKQKTPKIEKKQVKNVEQVADIPAVDDTSESAFITVKPKARRRVMKID